MKLLCLVLILVNSVFASNSLEKFANAEAKYVLLMWSEDDPFRERKPKGAIKFYKEPSLESEVIYELRARVAADLEAGPEEGYDPLTLQLDDNRLGKGPFGVAAVGYLAGLLKKGVFYLVQIKKGFAWVHEKQFVRIVDIKTYFKKRGPEIYFVFPNENRKYMTFFREIDGPKLSEKHVLKWKQYMENPDTGYEGKILDLVFKNGRLWVQVEFKGNFGDTISKRHKHKYPSLKKPIWVWFRPFNDKGKIFDVWGFHPTKKLDLK